MAFRLSPHLTVMANAAQKAAKRLLRDFAEVEQLQVSVKGPSDFVSQADIRAEQTLKEELNRARPGYCFPDGGIRRLGLRQLDLALDRRSVGRDDQLPARHAALGDQYRACSGGCRMASVGNPCRGDLRAGSGRDVLGGKRHRRLHERTPAAGFRSAGNERGGVRDRDSRSALYRRPGGMPSAGRWPH